MRRVPPCSAVVTRVRNTYDAHEDVRRFAVPSRASPRGICRYVPSIWGGEPSALQFSSPLSSLPPSPRRLWKISAGFPLLYPPRSFYSLVSAKATRRISHVGESARRRRRAARRKRAQARPARTDPPHGVGFVGGVGFVDVSFPPSLLIRHPCDIFLLFCEGLVFGFGFGWGLGRGELRVFCVCVGGVCVSVLAGVPLPPSI